MAAEKHMKTPSALGREGDLAAALAEVTALRAELDALGAGKPKPTAYELEPPPSPAIPGMIDIGIQRAVRVLQSGGIETFESCEGGADHAYPEPTVRFHGTPEAGWRAVGICLAYGLPILSLRRVWYILDSNEPTGPDWELTFRTRLR
jgi:hypothetical protein